MCNVLIVNANEDKEFIIYNHLFSKEQYSFTISELMDDLKQYNLELSKELVQKEVDGFIQVGLIKQNFRRYSICVR